MLNDLVLADACIIEGADMVIPLQAARVILDENRNKCVSVVSSRSTEYVLNSATKTYETQRSSNETSADGGFVLESEIEEKIRRNNFN